MNTLLRLAPAAVCARLLAANLLVAEAQPALGASDQDGAPATPRVLNNFTTELLRLSRPILATNASWRFTQLRPCRRRSANGGSSPRCQRRRLPSLHQIPQTAQAIQVQHWCRRAGITLPGSRMLEHTAPICSGLCGQARLTSRPKVKPSGPGKVLAGTRVTLVVQERRLSVAVITAHLGVNLNTIHKWLTLKKMPGKKLGHLWTFLTSEPDARVKATTAGR